jgi:hypothetical protein
VGSAGCSPAVQTREGLTVFALLEAALWSFGSVKVVKTEAGARASTTSEKRLVGYRGLVSVWVIVEPGFCCMGAYLVGPVCIWYGIAKEPTASLAMALPPGAILLLVVGT